MNPRGSVGRGLGILTSAWGGGMVLGSFLAPAIAARLSRERAIAVAIAVAGGAFVMAAGATSVWPVALAWAVAGATSGLANVAYETLLQEHTPDGFRGRVFATVEAVQDAMFLAGALLVATVGAAGGFGPVGLAFLGVAAVAVGVLIPERRADVTSRHTPLDMIELDQAA